MKRPCGEESRSLPDQYSGVELHGAPCCRFMPDCNHYNLLKLIYFLLSLEHKYICCNFSISMTFGGKKSAFFTP